MNELNFQTHVRDWVVACFGQEIADDRGERNHRFIEEALELAQSHGVTKREVLQLLDYVYDRPVGEPEQEVGGTFLTFLALCSAYGYDAHSLGNVELSRVWGKIEKIRAKQKAKPKFSPLAE